MTTKIAITGASGRMGQALIDAMAALREAELAGLTDGPGSAWYGRTVAGLPVSDDPTGAFHAAQVAVDFSVPEATRRHAVLAAETGTALVIGTTGLTAQDQTAVDDAARHVPIVQAANFSLGVNLLQALTRQAAARLGADWDIEILEMHHRHKVDAPSGTALALGRAAADGRGVDLADVTDSGRHGHTGERRTGDIGFAVLRGGDVAGEHSVIFAGQKERLTLSHEASDRSIFAHGALRAALWAAEQPAGHYSMADVLGLA